MLKLPVILSGKVEHGRKLGSSFNIPTANIVPGEDISGLEYGVYYSVIYIEEKAYKGITNLGTKPTVNDENSVNVESFIYDFEGDLYGREIKVELLEFKRPEMKFENVNELFAQVKEDLDAGRNYVAG